MTTRFDRLGKLVRRGGRSPVTVAAAGGVAPTITTPPVVSWTVVIGNSPTLTDPVYTGDAGTITWTLYRDGAADGVIVDVTKATAETYTAVAADIGPDLYFESTVTNGSGSDSANSNTVVFDDATYLPLTAIGVSTSGLTLADSDTTVDSWAATLGGLSQTLTAPVAADRPAYSATGGTGSRPLVTFDGSTDVLRGTLTKGSAFTTIECGMVGGVLSVANNDAFFAWQNTNTRLIMITGATARAFVMSTGPFNGSTGVLSSTRQHHSIDATGGGGTSNYRVNGTVQNSGTAVAASILDGSVCALAALATASSFANVDCQAWYFGVQLTADQRTHLRALLTYHTGVSS